VRQPQDGVGSFFLVMFFLKKEDRPGLALPPTPRSRRTREFKSFGDYQGMSLLARFWPILTLSWFILAFNASKTIQDASKTSLRASKTPPRASKTSQTTPCRRPKNNVFRKAFQSFRCPELSWPNMASKTTSRASRTPS